MALIKTKILRLLFYTNKKNIYKSLNILGLETIIINYK